MTGTSESRKHPATKPGATSAFQKGAAMNDSTHTTALLAAEMSTIRALNADVVDADDIGTFAVEYAINHWPVFPLRGKYPAIAGGRGVHDATTDVDQIIAWWAGRYRGCNIGGRVPDRMFVIDVDPRNGGDRSLALLEAQHHRLPETLATLSGRGDGGRHLFYRRPAGKLTAANLGPGIDLKTPAGYVVLPPSIHPDSGKPYTRIDAPVVEPPRWLVALIVKPDPVPTASPSKAVAYTGPSVADQYTDAASWADVLEPHGWRCLDADPDADGARWRHPQATAKWSATIKHGNLFCYTPNTPFDPTEPGDPRGYTRFRAFAVLNHGGDLKAATKALRGAA